VPSRWNVQQLENLVERNFMSQVNFTNEQLQSFAVLCADNGTRVINRLFGFRNQADPVAAANALESVDQVKAVREIGKASGLLNSDQIQALTDRMHALIG